MDRELLSVLIERYKRAISDPICKEYDTGYIDGVVDTLGDLVSFLRLDDLEEFAEAMEKLQTKIYDNYDMGVR